VCIICSQILVRQPYLPQIYIETDVDATRCYLFFQRMALKTDLINIITAQAHNLPESLNHSVSETLVGVCEVAFICFVYVDQSGTTNLVFR
jgi:dynactin 1